MDNPLSSRVLVFIRRHTLVSPGETVVVGVSGGPDSICLTHIFKALSDELGIKLQLAHLNHRLRGSESDEDEAYVSRTAQEFNLPLSLKTVDVNEYRLAHRLSLEEAAREVRYRFFAEVALSVNASRVAIGHTSDDSVETILLHLLRGSGIQGLVGLRPLANWRDEQKTASITIVRPLLEIRREDTEEYCRSYGLNPRYDSSNLSVFYLRNRIRNELIPSLETYNPNLKKILLRTAGLAADDLDYIQGEAMNIFHQVFREDTGSLKVEASIYKTLPVSIQRQLLRIGLKQLLGTLKDIEWRHIENLRQSMYRPAGKKLSFPKGIIIETGYQYHVIGTVPYDDCPYPPLPGEHRLSVPGETKLPGWVVRVEVVDNRVNLSSLSGGVEPCTALIDAGKAGDELYVRGRRPGDRFKPLGMTADKKLQDFMVDARIPKSWRDRVPVVYSPEHIVWLVGYRIDNRVRISEEMRRVLRIQFIKSS